ncbi:hypothetical protein HDV01_007748 [Terramyces sp. JEL0728]|nr:hypothetical protein HDV01_007748 [Terramyces sp. JEL0728]
MDDGSFRCDVNISVREVGDALGNRVELKHLHKFSAIGAAIETRGYDLTTGESFVLREKEGADEYYFIQDGDIPKVNITKEYVKGIEKLMPEGLDGRRKRLHQELGLSLEHVDILMSEPGAVEYFEQFLILLQSPNYEAKSLVNWVTGELMGMLGKEKLRIIDSPVDTDRLALLVDCVLDQKVSSKPQLIAGVSAKKVLQMMVQGNSSTPDEIITNHGWMQDNTIQLDDICARVIDQNGDIVKQINPG